MVSTTLNTTANLLLWMHPGSYFFSLFFQTMPVAFATENFGVLQDKNKNSKVNKVFDSIVNEFQTERLPDVDLFLSPHHLSAAEAITSYIDRGLIVSPNFVEKDEEAFRFLCKRQLYHILNLNPTKTSIKMAVILNTTMLIIRRYFDCSFFTSALFYFVILTLSRKIFIGPLERKADDFAIEHASVNELKGGLRWVKAQQGYLYSIMNFTNSIFGPFSSAQVRANKIQTALNKHGVNYDPKDQELMPISDLFDIALKRKRS